ncbi:MAG: energy-coupling factor transporter ATPase [Ruminococcus sp.]|nr:energy-coupling factor transporter ATPase [Ruminococcus sp.]
MNVQLKADHVWFHYTDEEGNRTSDDVLKDVSLEIEKGSFTAVLGHNGSGKSTLARLMNGILVPGSGTVLVEGMDTRDEDLLYDIRRHVGMVFQNPDNQIVATIVEEDVAFGPENLGIDPAEIRRRVDDALRAVDMYDYRLHAPSQLSGGQKQRVAIAGIIAMRPDCIILDEPTAMLDPRGRREVMKTIRMLNREFGITVVLITHYMDEAVQADRVVVMDDGKIILDNVPQAVFTKPELLQAVGLDVPQAAELLQSLGEAGLPITVSAIDEASCVDAIMNLFA